MKKYHIVVAVLIVCSLLIIWKCIDFVRYRSFSKYNVWPAQAVSKYLDETYGGEYTLVSTEFEKGFYYLWKFQYRDVDGLLFSMYYREEYDGPNGLNLYLDYDYEEFGIIDFYWQAKLNKEFEEEFDLDTYNIDNDIQHNYTTAKYCFNIKTEEDINETAEIISTIYMYTYEHVKKPTYKTLACWIEYQGKFLFAIDSYDKDYDYENIEKEEFKEYIIEKIREELVVR